MSEFAESYAGQLRKAWGKRQLITPGAAGVILDCQDSILLTRRRDNGEWVMPAGAIELDESITDCLRREIREETGLEVISATAIAIYTDPKFTFANAFDEIHQMFALVFRIDEWTGQLLTETDETTDARFFRVGEFPDNTPNLYYETVEDLLNFKGNLIVK